MVVVRGPSLAAVLLLLSSGHHCLSPPPLCPDLCTCQRDPWLLNCSSAGLHLVPRNIPDSVTELHLSHNHLPSVALDQPLHQLQALRLDNNSIAHLSLCLDRTPGGQRGHRLRPWGRRGCDSWAPSLQLLSVERNQLRQLPEGLEGSALLQILHVSFNRISSLRPGQFSRLQQLTELHLQHNLITSLYPQTFQDLTQLRVLDLSFNMLTSLHPLMHLSLRSIGAEVMLAGNQWHCDCSLRSLRRRMLYDRNRGLEAWNVECASPSILSGRDLLQVEESKLNCFSAENNAELHQDITVHRGSEILLSCSAQDSAWLTPKGQVPVGDRQTGLRISDITEGDTGLYLCVSKEDNALSVFNLQISRNKSTKRRARSLPRTDGQISQDNSDRMIQVRNQGVTQSNLALAVCLSVFITFLVAFIVGVLSRPWLDHLWQRMTNKNRPPETTVVSTAEQRQYENQAFSCCEEPDGVCTHRERRVTFTSVDIDVNSNVQQHDVRQENINKYEAAKADRHAHRAGDSGSETSSQSSQEENRRTDAGLSKNTQLEYIQETSVPKTSRRHSSSSDSSVFDDTFTGDRIKPPQVSEDFIQQRAPEWKGKGEPITSLDDSQNFGFPSEPFEDWSPHAGKFEFSDSVRSVSSSSSGSCSLKNSKQTDKEEVTKWNDNPPEVTKDVLIKNSIGFQQRSGASAMIPPGLQGDYRYDTQSNALRPKSSVSSYSSDSEDNTIKQESRAKDGKYGSDRVAGEKDAQQKVVPLPRTKLPGTFVISGHGKPPAVYSSSSSSESKLKPTGQKMKQKRNKVNPRAKVKASGNIKGISSHSDSSSSRGSKVETSQVQRQELIPAPWPPVKASQSVGSDYHWPAIDLQHATRVKRRLDIKVKSSGSQPSSSSDSKNETNHIKKQEQWETSARLPVKAPYTGTPGQPWPAIDLLQKTRVKRRLDIKAPSPKSDTSSGSDSEGGRGHSEKRSPGGHTTITPFEESSSSSNSEDETPHSMKKVEHWEAPTSRLPIKEPQIMKPDQWWPAVDLQHRVRLKRRLDFKIQSPDLSSSFRKVGTVSTKVDVTRAPPHKSSSSSSNSEGDTSRGTEQEQRHPPIPLLPNYTPPAGRPGQQWSAVNPEQITMVKRQLDVQAPSPQSDTSSSSDSEDDHQRPGVVPVSRRPIQKAHSSSSSDSDDETSHITKQEQWQMSTPRLPPVKVSPTVSAAHLWPAVNLERTTKVKRRLDIRAPSTEDQGHSGKQKPGQGHVSQHLIQESHSSSSDSEDETSHIIKQEQWQTSTARVPINTPTGKPDNQWPAVDLGSRTKIKRRLDIKVLSAKSDTSSSSDSEDDQGHKEKQRPGGLGVSQRPLQESHSSSSSDSEEETRQIKKQQQWQTSTNKLPNNTSPTGSPGQRWPVINLLKTTKVKRRLDVRIASFYLNTSSSRDSEDNRSHGDEQRTGKACVPQYPIHESHSSSSSDSEDETSHITKQEQWQTARGPINTPTGSPDNQWPAINLGQTTKVKRRLDFKVLSPKSDTSSSSDSEDDQGHRGQQRPGKVAVSRRPIQESQASSSSDSDNETRHIKKQGQWQTSTTSYSPVKLPQTVHPGQQWPAVDLGRRTKIKRRLDIKVLSPKSDLSSSSDSEDDQGHKDRQRPGGIDVSQRPLQESHSSSSSDSEEETRQIKKQEQWQTSANRLPNNTSPTGSPGQRWPAINLLRTTKVKRRLDIKVRSSDSSQLNMPRPSLQEHYNPDTMWPQLDLLNLRRVKRRLDIKAPSYDSDSSSSSDSEDEKADLAKPGLGLPIVSSNTPKDSMKFSGPQVSPELELLWAKMNLGKSRFRKNLEITSRKQETVNPPSLPPPIPPHYTSYDRGADSKLSTRAEGITHTESFSEPKDMDEQDFSSILVERQRKDSSPSSDSFSSDEEDVPRKDLVERWRGQAQSSSQIYPSPNLASSMFKKSDQPQSQEPEDKQMGMDLKILSEFDPLQSPVVLPNTPSVSGDWNTASLQMESSSDINSQPDLSPGFPATTRSLKNKIPAPNSSSSSSSESENEITKEGADILRQTDSPITYNRSIFKSSSLLGSSALPMGYRKHPMAKRGTDEVEGPSGNQGSTEASLRPKAFPSMGFKELLIKTRAAQSRTTEGVEVPPEIKWNGIGRWLTPISNKSELTPTPEPTKTELSLLDDSSTTSEVAYNIKREGLGEVLIPQHWTQSVSHNPASGRIQDKFDTSPGGPNEILRVKSDSHKERKGLSALKAMSTERKKWDPDRDSVSSPHFNGYESPISTRFRSTGERKPQTQLPPHSNAGHVEGVQNFLYDIPLYRRHAAEATTPHAVPATPPPDEVHIPAWRSPQSSLRVLDVETQPGQSRNTGEPSPYNVAEHFDNPYKNISSV